MLLCVLSRSFFHLVKSDFQITELLGEVTLKENKKTQSDEYLRKLKLILDSLPEGKDRLVNTIFWFCLLILSIVIVLVNLLGINMYGDLR